MIFICTYIINIDRLETNLYKMKMITEDDIDEYVRF